MSRWMNAELIAIRDSLTCGHCGSIFRGSDSQAWKVKYEKKGGAVYCSDVCRQAAVRNKRSKPLPNRGPCGTCGKEFFSRTAKQFCGMKCYTGSKMFSDMLAAARDKTRTPESIEKRAAQARKGKYVKCLECGEEFYQKRQDNTHQTKKLCSRVCYRAYMSKRFDRWIANPKGMALPQCYDEFLDREELDCIVEGCGWHGRGLSSHVNIMHGIQANEFKRAAGFNVTTGLVSKDLAMALSERPKRGIALGIQQEQAEENFAKSLATRKSEGHIHYLSKEGAEHRVKARALNSEPGPTKTCCGCGCEFQQSTPNGRALYCSVECRSEAYKRNSHALKPPKTRRRDNNGRFCWVAPDEHSPNS